VPDPALAEALQASVTDVLEKMFFIRGLGGGEEPAGGGVITAHLAFRGEPSGSLTLRIGAPGARGIAADFLGAEEAELSDREVGEVVCELANMVCGSVLSRVESAATFRLATPRLVDPHEIPPGEASAEHTVEIAGGVMVVSLETEATECSSPAPEYAS